MHKISTLDHKVPMYSFFILTTPSIIRANKNDFTPWNKPWCATSRLRGGMPTACRWAVLLLVLWCRKTAL